VAGAHDRNVGELEPAFDKHLGEPPHRIRTHARVCQRISVETRATENALMLKRVKLDHSRPDDDPRHLNVSEVQ
jgi:hypothetical protein